MITPTIPEETPENVAKNLDAIWRGISKEYLDGVIIELAEFRPNPMRDAWNLFVIKAGSEISKEALTWLIVFQRRDETVHVKGPIVQILTKQSEDS